MVICLVLAIARIRDGRLNEHSSGSGRRDDVMHIDPFNSFATFSRFIVQPYIFVSPWAGFQPSVVRERGISPFLSY